MPVVAKKTAPARKTVQAPARTAAPTAPARPGRPVATASAEAPRRGPGRPPKAPTANGSPAHVAPARPNGNAARTQAPPVAPVDVSAMQREIGSLKGTILALNETIEKLKAKPSNVRAVSEILDGAEANVAEGDWRLPYHGTEILVHQYETDANGKITVIHDGATVEDENGDTVYQDGHGEAYPPIPMLLAIPRDNDVAADPKRGSLGARARAQGMIALHYERREDGSFQGAPEYLDTDQLGAVWAS